MTSTVLFSVIDCDTQQPIASAASDNTGALAENANAVYTVTIPDGDAGWTVLVQGLGIGYESQTVTFTPSQSGALQKVCLKKAPAPAPTYIGAPQALQLASYENQTATFWWVNSQKYDKILFAWSVKGGTDVQTDLPGNATSHAVSPIYPNTDYTITLEGGVSSPLGLSWDYSHPPTTFTWHSPPGLWPLPATGALVPGHRVAAVARDPQQLDVFSVDHAGAVRSTAWHDDGSLWSGLAGPLWSLGGAFAAGAPVTAISRTTDHLDLFVTDPHGVVQTSYWQPNEPWTPWRAIGGFFPPNAPVTAASRVPNQIDLFITGKDGHVYWQLGAEGAEWTGVHNNWTDIGGIFPPGAPVAATTRNSGQFDLFIVGNNGIIYTSSWYLGSDWSGKGNRWAPIGG